MRLSEFIELYRESIVARILTKLGDISPELAQADVPASVPAALDELVRALEQPGSVLHARLPKSMSGASHGRERQRHGEGIDVVARDFGTLCDAIMAEGLERGFTPLAREFQVMNLAIDEAIAAAVQEYWSQALVEHEQTTSKRLGMLVHELRNTLQSVTVAFNVISRGEVGTMSKTASMLERGLKRMGNLVDHTLTAVKLQMGVELKPTRFRVADLIRDVEAANSPLSRKIALRTEASEDLELDADVSLITSALGNLVDNALKFTRDGTVVTVRARAVGPRALIEVEDECGGLPPGRPDDLFMPFVQRGQDRRGVGLGLAIVREAAEAHGGRVSVRDLPGKGCVFTLDLPRVRPELEDRDDMGERVAAAESAQAR